MSIRRDVAREVAVALFFILASVMMTWPLILRLRSAVSDNGDPLLNTWIVNWVQHAWSTRQDLFDAPIFYPSRLSLAYSENLIGIALVTYPLHFLGAPALAVYNVGMILGFALSGYGAYVLARTTTGSLAAGIASGCLFAFVPFRFEHVSHLQIVWAGWLPLFLAAMLAYWRRPSWMGAGAMAATFTLNGLTNVHWLLFSAVAAAASAIVLALTTRPRQPALFWTRLVAAGIVAAAVLVPVLQPYRTVSSLYGMRRVHGEVFSGSAVGRDWLIASPNNVTYGNLVPDGNSVFERRLFPGLAMPLLAVLALALYRQNPVPEGAGNLTVISPATRVDLATLRILDAAAIAAFVLTYLSAAAPAVRWKIGTYELLLNSSEVPLLSLLLLIGARLSLAFPHAWQHHQPNLPAYVSRARIPLGFWVALTWVLIGFAGSFGVRAILHDGLFRNVEPFQSIRVPARWAMIAYTGLALMAGFGVAAVSQRTAGARRVMAYMVLAVVIGVDVRSRVPWEEVSPEIADVYRWIGTAKIAGPILELPVDEGGVEYQYLLGATAHHQPLLNGTSGFEPPLRARLRDMTQGQSLSADLLGYLEAIGTRVIVVHASWLGPRGQAVRDWARTLTGLGELGFVRRFDASEGGDWVFAVTKNWPDWRRHVSQEADAIGMQAPELLLRFLAGEPTFSNQSFGFMDSPRYDQSVEGPLRVTGWALAANGIAGVEVLLDGGRRRYRAQLVPRPDIQQRYPWYPQVPTPGFQWSVDRRPKGIPRRTTVQIELVDGAGSRSRFPPARIVWR